MEVVVVIGTEEIFFEREKLKVVNRAEGPLAILNPDLDTNDRTIAVFNKWDYWFYLPKKQ